MTATATKWVEPDHTSAYRETGYLRETHYRDFHEWLRGKYAEHGKTGVYFR